MVRSPGAKGSRLLEVDAMVKESPSEVGNLKL